MASTNNTFLKGKMNKDLSLELVAPNEYRDARNVIVTETHDGNAGSLQASNGNLVINTFSSNENIEVIGRIVDDVRGYVYLFITDYTDSADGINVAGDTNLCAIVAIELNTVNNIDVNSRDGVTYLVEGKFLNFSKNSPIYGVNIIEEFLFWTDNRNQPRKISLVKAFNNAASETIDNAAVSRYYTKEDHISVAKSYPFRALDMTMEFQNEDTLTGDFNYLKDKFVRFAYRYEYDTKEVSPISPFTAIAFKPKSNGAITAEEIKGAMDNSILSTMENSINVVNLSLPSADNAHTSMKEELLDKKVSKIHILLKESDALAIKLVEEVDVASMNNTATTFDYIYTSRKPVKVLPESQTVRVYDKVPLKALAQEAIGNRVVYGNFVDKHSSPKGLDYLAGYKPKKLVTQFSTLPRHSIKQGRSYQIGVVLVDRYGRHSEVIPSNTKTPAFDFQDGKYKGDSVFVPYLDNADAGDNTTTCLAVSFESVIDIPKEPLASDDNLVRSGQAGMYDAVTNPLGWYSYKIVVKQQEQEYYNVYLPGLLNGNLIDSSGDDSVFYTILTNDNINKVPRVLTEVGPEQKQFSSNSNLRFRVVPEFLSDVEVVNFPKAFVNPELSLDVTSVSAFNESDILGDNNDINVNNLYNTDRSNPLICRIKGISGTSIPKKDEAVNCFTVAETDPFTSELDIYWETSSSGLLTELNEGIALGNDWQPEVFEESGQPIWKESTPGLNYVAGDAFDVSGGAYHFSIQNRAGDYISDVTLKSVVNGLGTDVTSEFGIDGTDTTRFITRTEPLVYQGYLADSPAYIASRTYTITVEATSTKDTSTATREHVIVLQFVDEPLTVSGDNFTVTPTSGNGVTVIGTIQGTNGAVWPDIAQEDITYSIRSHWSPGYPQSQVTLKATFSGYEPGANAPEYGEATFTIDQNTGEVRALLTDVPPNGFAFALDIIVVHVNLGSTLIKKTLVYTGSIGAFSPAEFSNAFNIE